MNLWNSTAIWQVWRWYQVHFLEEMVLLELSLFGGKQLLRIAIYRHVAAVNGETLGYSFAPDDPPESLQAMREYK